MGSALASGYQGPPELTLTRVFTEWTLDPWMLALVVILGVGYLVGARRANNPDTPDNPDPDISDTHDTPDTPDTPDIFDTHDTHDTHDTSGTSGTSSTSSTPGTPSTSWTSWPVARQVWFLGLGLGFLVIATMSWVGTYQAVLFYARAVQTVLLVLVVPLFLALGRPITLAAVVFPRAGARLEAVIRSRAARVLTFPAITALALVGVPFVMYFTSWYTAVFHSATVRELTYLALMAPGFAFFWTLLRVDPVPKAYSYGVSMWIAGAEVIGDAFFGIAVIADQNLLGGAYYHALARPWGPSLATDQVIGGGVLWVLGDLVGLPFLAAQLIQLMREDESDAARIDAELDAREAAKGTKAIQTTQAAELEMPSVAASPAGPASPVPSAEPEQASREPEEPRPWWADDPRFTGRFKPL